MNTMQTEIMKMAKNSGGLAGLIVLIAWMLHGELQDIKQAMKDVSARVEQVDDRVSNIETEKRVRKEMEDEK
ncbi:hypothetical protein [Kordiimonas sp. SCSIO 12610]|uniref:hypothetical protein n=1 Tax=Kordiimonas sp. SCSIO 12610 TaxID=2829597 RepID=UPI00210BA2D5|nr:hypothetical protein [Kordiimonas sp. SCSIO 12610]UTW53971.1 hypothetical protein KFF44_08965 [Kordiimonas sp. SCSIO 12610]